MVLLLQFSNASLNRHLVSSSVGAGGFLIFIFVKQIDSTQPSPLNPLNRDSPDDPGTGLDIRAFPAFPQDSREVRTATGASGSPDGGRGADLAIFAGIWTHSSHQSLLNV